jgi:hypothetical protein
VAGFCKHGNESYVSMKRGKGLTQRNAYQLQELCSVGLVLESKATVSKKNYISLRGIIMACYA